MVNKCIHKHVLSLVNKLKGSKVKAGVTWCRTADVTGRQQVTDISQQTGETTVHTETITTAFKYK